MKVSVESAMSNSGPRCKWIAVGQTLAAGADPVCYRCYFGVAVLPKNSSNPRLRSTVTGGDALEQGGII
jgi:hypothetical protein